MKHKKVIGFGDYLVEKKSNKSDKTKYDKLIKDLEDLNDKDNEHVKAAISILKQGRDLSENNEMVRLMTQRIKEDPNDVLAILENLFEETNVINHGN